MGDCVNKYDLDGHNAVDNFGARYKSCMSHWKGLDNFYRKAFNVFSPISIGGVAGEAGTRALGRAGRRGELAPALRGGSIFDRYRTVARWGRAPTWATSAAKVLGRVSTATTLAAGAAAGGMIGQRLYCEGTALAGNDY